jgi:hypothetical protein
LSAGGPRTQSGGFARARFRTLVAGAPAAHRQPDSDPGQRLHPADQGRLDVCLTLMVLLLASINYQLNLATC